MDGGGCKVGCKAIDGHLAEGTARQSLHLPMLYIRLVSAARVLDGARHDMTDVLNAVLLLSPTLCGLLASPQVDNMCC